MEIEKENQTEFSITINGILYQFDALEKKQFGRISLLEEIKDIKKIIEQNNLKHKIISVYLKTFTTINRPKSKLY